MEFKNTSFAENIPRLHRAYRSAKRSKKPIALVITEYDSWHYEVADLYADLIHYFTKQGEDISNQIYSLAPKCCEVYREIIRKEKSCVVVKSMIRLGNSKISRFSILNLETTCRFVHDFITCLSPDDCAAAMEVKDLLRKIGFHVILFKFRNVPGYNIYEAAIDEALRDLDDEERFPVNFNHLSDKIYYSRGRSDVPVYLNGVKIHEFDTPCEYSDTKALLCPGCFKAITFGRDDESQIYVKTEEAEIFDDLDKVSTPRGFTHHTRHCLSPFPKEGICKVVTNQQQYSIKRLALLSKKDAHWDFALVDDSFFRDGDGIVYAYVNNGIPASYVAFLRKDIPNHGSTYVIWDLYTLMPYRRRGLATAVLDYGIEELGINREYLPVSLPLTKYSRNIIPKTSTKYLMGRGGKLYDRETSSIPVKH